MLGKWQCPSLRADFLPGGPWKGVLGVLSSYTHQTLEKPVLLSSLALTEPGQLAPRTGEAGSGGPLQLSSGSRGGGSGRNGRGYSENWEGLGS